MALRDLLERIVNKEVNVISKEIKMKKFFFILIFVLSIIFKPITIYADTYGVELKKILIFSYFLISNKDQEKQKKKFT